MTDSRYLDATPAMMVEAYWEDHYYRMREEGRAEEEEVEDEVFDEIDMDALIAKYPDDWEVRVQTGDFEL